MMAARRRSSVRGIRPAAGSARIQEGVCEGAGKEARLSIRVCIPVIAYYVSRSLVALHLEVTIRGVIPST